MQHVVIGAGEVGRAVAEVLEAGYPGDVHLRDLEPSGPKSADALHIAFPWSPGFAHAVDQYRTAYRPAVVIVHSTVPVGTCDALGVVHSPVTGRHPELTLSLRLFTKFFGGRQARFASSIFALLGISTQITDRAATTEAGKLWELTQYGLAIVVERQIHEYCAQHGVDFDVVYGAMARSYNAGYSELGLERFARPVIDHQPGPIGGHCVLPGSRMLDHPIGRAVADLGAADGIAIWPELGLLEATA